LKGPNIYITNIELSQRFIHHVGQVTYVDVPTSTKETVSERSASVAWLRE